jgi:hypothetical protein
VSRLVPRAGLFGIALTAWKLWQRLPEAQRRQAYAAARKHGPRLAMQAREAAQRRRHRQP